MEVCRNNVQDKFGKIGVDSLTRSLVATLLCCGIYCEGLSKAID